MKHFLVLILCAVGLMAHAQVVTGVRPAPDATFGQWSDWKTVEVSFDDGTLLNIEYRLVLASRKGMACNYDVEVKNPSDIKLDVTFVYQYYDKLVKKDFAEKEKVSLKPGKTGQSHITVQGCKKDKGSTLDGEALCHACDFGVDIYVSK